MIDYQRWIKVLEESVPLRGNCQIATAQMVVAFTELRRVAGFVRFLGGDKASHWWCLTPSGEVVDPSVIQYLRAYIPPIIGYEPYDRDLHGPIRVGSCMNCGDAIYDDSDYYIDTCCIEVCSEACEHALSEL